MEKICQVVVAFAGKEQETVKVVERLPLSVEEFELMVECVKAHYNFMLMMSAHNPMTRLLNLRRINLLDALWLKIKQYEHLVKKESA